MYSVRMIHRKYFGFVLFERQIVKICFFPLFSGTSSISFSKQPSKNDAIVHGFSFFFLFLINFYLLSLFRPYFFIVKKTKERGCCNPVGGIKEFFPFFFFKFYLQRNQIVCTKRITVVLIIILWNKKIWIEEISIFRTKFVYSFLITDSYLLFIDIEFVFFSLFLLWYRKIWFEWKKNAKHTGSRWSWWRMFHMLELHISEHEDQWGSVGGNQPVYPSSLSYHRRAHKFWDDTTVLRARSRLDY